MGLPNDIISADQLAMEESKLVAVEAERGFLACLIRSPFLIHEAENRVVPGDLWHSDHHYAYRVMLAVKKGAVAGGWDVSFDPISMLNAARRDGPAAEQRFLQRTDGLDKMRQLEALSRNIDVARFDEYVAAVRDSAARILLYRGCREMQQKLQDFQRFPSATDVAMLGESMMAESICRFGEDDDARISKVTSSRKELLRDAQLAFQYPNAQIFNIHCALFPSWMKLMGGSVYGGFRRKGLTMLCARPKVGKTTILMNIAVALAMGRSDPFNPAIAERPRIPVLFMDTEMSRVEILSRELSHCSGWQEQDILAGKMYRDGTLDSEINEALEAMQEAELYYVNIAGKPIEYTLSVMRQFKHRFVGSSDWHNQYDNTTYTLSNPAMVVYDWLKLPDASLLQGNTAEHQALGFQCSRLKDAARVLDLAVIAGAQNNREAVNASPSDWEQSAERYAASSDRLAQFCSQMAMLRNVSTIESDGMLNHFDDQSMSEPVFDSRFTTKEANGVLVRGERREGHGGLPFNQVLHVTLNRNGPDCRSGIPVYHDRGRFAYTDMGYHEGIEKFREEVRAERRGKKKLSVQLHQVPHQ